MADNEILFIKIVDGKPVDHPIIFENLKEFIPNLNVYKPPEGYTRFIRKPAERLTKLQKIESSSYVIDEELSKLYNIPIWTDKHVVRDLTDEEIIQMVDTDTKALNERMQQLQNAPYPAPEDGNLYVWSSIDNQWLPKPDNFDEIVNQFSQKLEEYGFTHMTPEELENISEDKKQVLQKMIDDINNAIGEILV